MSKEEFITGTDLQVLSRFRFAAYHHGHGYKLKRIPPLAPVGFYSQTRYSRFASYVWRFTMTAGERKSWLTTRDQIAA